MRAMVVGVALFLYAYSFLILKNTLWSSIFLMISGVGTVAVLTSLFRKFKDEDHELALWAFALGTVGALGALVHGGYDLANVINPVMGGNSDLPSQVDPRGLLTFGLAGVSVVSNSWLMCRVKSFPRNLANLGLLLGALLVVVYLARLTVLDLANPWLKYPVLAEGFVVGPIWYIWLGSILNKQK